MPVTPGKFVSPTFTIRSVPVYGDAILAPMDGFSDWPFRSICRSLGSAMSYTEFINSEFLVRAFKHMQQRMYYDESERPVTIQIYGDDPEMLVEAARLVETKQPDIIDINMGCPAKTVVHRGAGVGLMRTPVKVARILRRVNAALQVPLTVKIRIGWEECRTYKLIARIAEEEGASAIAIHGRTKEQGYGGEADWDVIAEVKAAVGIPVIGNGDVRTAADIERMKKHTNCDAVMIGRASIGNPWIFSRLDRSQVPPDAVRQMVHLHLERCVQFYGPYKGIVLFRKHAMQYMKLNRLSRARRTEIILQDNAESFLALLDRVYGELEEKQDTVDAE
jgi:nifR3 family TIM-barrel protein